MLEVILALVLFVGAATVITAGLRASLDGIDRLRFNTHAADLAVSLLSEIKIGARPVEVGEAQPFEPPFELWTWQMLADESSTATRSASARTVEVVVRQPESDLTFRLTESIRSPSIAERDEGQSSDPSFGTGLPQELREGE